MKENLRILAENLSPEAQQSLTEILAKLTDTQVINLNTKFKQPATRAIVMKAIS